MFLDPLVVATPPASPPWIPPAKDRHARRADTPQWTEEYTQNTLNSIPWKEPAGDNIFNHDCFCFNNKCNLIIQAGASEHRLQFISRRGSFSPF